MTLPTPNQNLIPNEPELKDAFALAAKDVFLRMNCHHIGVIQGFDAAKQTATVTIAYKKTYLQPNTTGVYQLVNVDYPVITEAPVISLGGGKGSLRFPIAVGDQCLVLFNDRDIDVWFSGNNSGQPATPRLHSFSDAVVLVGLRSAGNVLPDFSATDVELVNGDARATLKPDGEIVLTAKATGAVATLKPTGEITFQATTAGALVTLKANGDVTLAAAAAGVLVTLRHQGGMVIANTTGNFTFEDNADVTFDTGTVQGLFGHGGHVQLVNKHGPGATNQDYTKLLYQMLLTINATIPLADLANFLTFVEP